MTRRVHRRTSVRTRWNAFGAQQAEVDLLVGWLDEWGDIPRAQQLREQLVRAASVAQREKVAKKIVDFMISLQTDPEVLREMAGFAEEAAREETSAINTALILGGLGVGESGLVQPMVEPPPPARTEPTPHLRATQRRRGTEQPRQPQTQLQAVYRRAVRAIYGQSTDAYDGADLVRVLLLVQSQVAFGELHFVEQPDYTTPEGAASFLRVVDRLGPAIQRDHANLLVQHIPEADLETIERDVQRNYQLGAFADAIREVRGQARATRAAPARPQPGTVIAGTMRPEDLIPAFYAALRGISPARATIWRQAHGGLQEDLSDLSDDPEVLDDAVVELGDALSALAPPDHYFGAHPGDASDFGFWPIEEEMGEESPGDLDEYTWRRVFNRMPANPAEGQLQEAAEMLMAPEEPPVYWLVGYHTASIAHRAAQLPMPEEFVEEALVYQSGDHPPAWHSAGQAPFRAPHHTVSLIGMTGRFRDGVLRGGEIHLAHGGVLFLDEVFEFPRGVLQAVAGAWTNKGMNYRSGDDTFHTDTNFTLILATPMQSAQEATAAQVRRVLDIFTNVSVIPVGIGELPAAWLGQH